MGEKNTACNNDNNDYLYYNLHEALKKVFNALMEKPKHVPKSR